MPSSEPSSAIFDDDPPDDGSLLSAHILYSRAFGRQGREMVFHPDGCRVGGLVAIVEEKQPNLPGVVCITDLYIRHDWRQRRYGKPKLIGRQGAYLTLPRETLLAYDGPDDRANLPS